VQNSKETKNLAKLTAERKSKNSPASCADEEGQTFAHPLRHPSGTLWKPGKKSASPLQKEEEKETSTVFVDLLVFGVW